MDGIVYWSRKRCLGILFSLFCLLPGQVSAAVVIAGTRVIYPAQDKEVTLRIDNRGATPSLVQVWLDRGDPKSEPDKVDVPFVITPPIFRVDPGKAQTLRIAYTQEPLPQDKESVFWLNVLDIPPAVNNESGESNNYLQLTFRSRIKLFFRPSGLSGSSFDAATSLTWKLVDSGKGSVLRAINNSVYHVTVDRLNVDENGRKAQITGEMLAPGASRDFQFNGRFSQGAKYQFTWINDYGGTVVQEIKLSH